MNTGNQANFEMILDGMSCGKCKAKVEKVLTNNNPPAANASVDLQSKKVTFSVSRDAIEGITKTLTEMGYTVESVKEITA